MGKNNQKFQKESLDQLGSEEPRINRPNGHGYRAVLYFIGGILTGLAGVYGLEGFHPVFLLFLFSCGLACLAVGWELLKNRKWAYYGSLVLVPLLIIVAFLMISVLFFFFGGIPKPPDAYPAFFTTLLRVRIDRGISPIVFS